MDESKCNHENTKEESTKEEKKKVTPANKQVSFCLPIVPFVFYSFVFS
jgi:hypothetical protein